MPNLQSRPLGGFFLYIIVVSHDIFFRGYVALKIEHLHICRVARHFLQSLSSGGGLLDNKMHIMLSKALLL